MGGVRFCKSCGARILMQGYDTQNRIAYLMDKKQICYECAFWENIMAYPDKNMEILGNQCLKVMPYVKRDEKDRSITLGGKGMPRYFIRKNGKVFRSNDIWIIGTIPDRFLNKLKPTVMEISRYLYSRLIVHNRRCQSRTCFDRFQCFRYNIQLEQTQKTVKVPSDWIVGTERCKDFLNFDKLTEQDLEVYQKLYNKPNGRRNKQTAGESNGDNGR